MIDAIMPIDLELFRSFPVESRIQDIRPEILRLRLDSARWLREKLQLAGIAFKDVANDLVMEPSQFSHMLDRGLTMPLDSFSRCCDNYLNCSCSYLILGISQPTQAPKALQALIRLSQNICDRNKNALKELISEPINKDDMISVSELIFLRFQELADDRGIMITDLLDKRELSEIKAAFKTAYEQKYFSGRITTLIYICLALNISPDYLLRQDYSKFGLVLPSDQLSNLSKLDISVASHYLQLNPKQQAEFFAKVAYLSLMK